jgi:hypothetical protein
VTIRAGLRGASIVMSGAVASIFFCGMATVLPRANKSPSSHEAREQIIVLPPICLLIAPVGRRIHDAFLIRKEVPTLPMLECDY